MLYFYEAYESSISYSSVILPIIIYVNECDKYKRIGHIQSRWKGIQVRKYRAYDDKSRPENTVYQVNYLY